MSIIDELRKNVTDFTESVTKKSSAVIETQKLRMKRVSLESDIRDAYVMLGKLYEKRLKEAEGTDDEKDSAAAEILQKILEKKLEVANVADALMKAKGMIHCPSCGSDVSRLCAFCPKCGAKLEKPEECCEDKTDAPQAEECCEGGVDAEQPEADSKEEQ